MKGRRRSFGQRKSMSTGMVMSSNGSLRCLRPVLLEAHQQSKGRSYMAASCTHMADMAAGCAHMGHMAASCTHMAHMAESCSHMSCTAYMTGKLFFALEVVPAADHTHCHIYCHAP